MQKILKLSVILFIPAIIAACQTINNSNNISPSPSKSQPAINSSVSPSSNPPVPECSRPPAYEGYVVNVDGTNFKKVLSVDNNFFNAVLLSDDKNILYLSQNTKLVYKQNIETGQIQTILNDVYMFSVSPDNKRIAYTNSSGDFFITDIDGKNLKKLNTSSKSFIENIIWSHDSKKLAFESNQSSNSDTSLVFYITIYEPDTDKYYKTSDNQDFLMGENIVWSPDNKKLAYMSYNKPNDIFLFDLDKNHETKLSSDSIRKTNLFWSANSDKLFYYDLGENESSIYSLDMDGTKKLIVGNIGSGHIFSSNDSNFLAYAVTDNEKIGVYTLSTKDLSIKKLTDIDKGFLADMKWSPDNSKISLTVQDKVNYDKKSLSVTNNDLYMINADGTNKIRLTESPTSEFIYNWLSNNKILFYSDVDINLGSCNVDILENWDYNHKG